MPFKSEAQRRYLWANEPEIARDWTDTYGSGIAKALGGRIGFFKGAQADTASGKSMSPGTSASGGQRGEGPRDRHPPAQPVAHTVAPTAQYDDRIQRIAAQNQRTAALRGRASDQGFHQFLTPRTNYQRPTFGMRLRSGLGALGRGIGHVARNFNPVSLAFDNPLMKLLVSGYGRGHIGNLFQRNNQNINWKDPDQEEDIAWENINYDPNALTRLEQLGIMNPDILPQNDLYESYFDDRNLMAGNYSQNAVANQMLGANYDLLDPFQQQQIDDAINTYGTTSLGSIKT